jgi:HD-GYP domain-containing protein (c-di-GMP phosphodiesterase class II)
VATNQLAAALGLPPEVRDCVAQTFERWDGKGMPSGLKSEQILVPARVVNLADVVAAFHRAGGVDAAVAVARERSGTQFDPALVDCFLDRHADVLDGLETIRAWDEVIALDPRLGAPLTDAQLDRVLEAFADFADLKSPDRIGHSRGVAALAESAAQAAGLSDADAALLRRAGLVHDIGMIGVSSEVWMETKPWTLAQRERAQTHPYLTERMLARVPALADVARIAAMHHERLDGSGYPHGLTRDAIPIPARILAAADVYQALRQDRPHRPAMSADAARTELCAEATAGRLDQAAVDAVLTAVGERVQRPRAALPGGLTAREVEVLVQLAHGLSNPEIAAALTLSRKTVSSHLEHIFTKLGVTTRTQAALFAMREGLIGEPAGV